MGKDYKLIVGVNEDGEIMEIELRNKMIKIKMMRFEFKLQDFWIGVFWETHLSYGWSTPSKSLVISMWICLIPCFPLHVVLVKKLRLPTLKELASKVTKVTKTADFVKGVSSTSVTDEFYGEKK